MAAVGLLRLASLGQVALTRGEATESRYLAIAYRWPGSGDWITPWTGINSKIGGPKAEPGDARITPCGYPRAEPMPFGQAAFAVLAGRGVVPGSACWSRRRVRVSVAIVLVAATVWFAAEAMGKERRNHRRDHPRTSAELFVLAGACELDIPLAASTSLAMIAFAQFARGSGWRRNAWGLGFFLALAVGALAKGPVAWCWSA